ncbi:MAG: tripartite tricarboxylate transporter substrate binding protein [Ramlibacter sp.]|jgi:tripartite-type tricarboxylate transporter receptor subunit TctC|nr:tripartite tricarboxylate transporter substrate binding protein [Ramlibacter sp.]
MTPTKRLLIALATACACTAALAQAPAATAGGYPNRPITLVVPFAPGGSNDMIARAIGQELSKSLGQPVVIDNKAGAGGSIGAQFVARAPADGYTLMLVSSTLTVNSAVTPKIPYDAVKSFTPVVQVAKSPLMFVAKPNLAAKTPAELIALAKANPGKITFGSSGTGGVNHLGTELFAHLAGVKMIHVPYKGGTPAMNDILAGHVDVYMGTMPQVIAQVKGGKVRGIGVTSPQRVKSAPDVPAIAEALPDFSLELWWGVFGPANLPRDILALLNKQINEAISSTAMRQFMEAEGASPVGGTPEQFAGAVSAEVQRWTQVVKQANIKLD